jgi:ABC-type uncharacterized transport system auxiliary subunit
MTGSRKTGGEKALFFFEKKNQKTFIHKQGPLTRRFLLGAPLLAAGCSVLQQPYAERRQWPLPVERPVVLPTRRGGKVLEIRTLRAGPGLDSRGLQTLQPDGSVKIAFYEEWAVPPAEAVEDALRRWLSACGLFAAVVGPGSRVTADDALEGELGALWSDPTRQIAHAALSIVMLGMQPDLAKVALQRRFEEDAAMPVGDPGAQVQAQVAALTVVFAKLEAALREAVR